MYNGSVSLSGLCTSWILTVCLRSPPDVVLRPTCLANISGKRPISWSTVCLSVCVFVFLYVSKPSQNNYTYGLQFWCEPSLWQTWWLIFLNTQDIQETSVTYHADTQPSHTFLSQNHYGESPTGFHKLLFEHPHCPNYAIMLIYVPIASSISLHLYSPG